MEFELTAIRIFTDVQGPQRDLVAFLLNANASILGLDDVVDDIGDLQSLRLFRRQYLGFGIIVRRLIAALVFRSADFRSRHSA